MADRVGAILEEKYGPPHSQDLHIEYFFLLLGSEIIDKRGAIMDELNKAGKWENLENECPELIFSTGTFPKNSLTETERQREERLNQIIRMPLLSQLAVPNNPSNPPRIIISRACKYKTEVVKHSLSTPEIESILKTPSNEHLDYFYLMIKLLNIPSTVAPPSRIIIETLIAGNWRIVEPVTAWQLTTFIGFFPKLKPFETEREREWRLNQEVREPLKENLKDLLTQQFQAQGLFLPDKLVSIVLTRVCTYTKM